MWWQGESIEINTHSYSSAASLSEASWKKFNLIYVSNICVSIDRLQFDQYLKLKDYPKLLDFFTHFHHFENIDSPIIKNWNGGLERYCATHSKLYTFIAHKKLCTVWAKFLNIFTSSDKNSDEKILDMIIY